MIERKPWINKRRVADDNDGLAEMSKVAGEKPFGFRVTEDRGLAGPRGLGRQKMPKARCRVCEDPVFGPRGWSPRKRLGSRKPICQQCEYDLKRKI